MVPDWISKINDVYDWKTIKLYNVFHDCGKPYCRIVDANGQHFPDHANISCSTFKQYFDNEPAARLIKEDMALHTLTVDEILSRGWDRKFFQTLLVSALAELNSNAKMFGGFESTSFKIKYKRLKSRGNYL